MFKGYRELLKILCDEGNWCTDFKKIKVDKFLFKVTKDIDYQLDTVSFAFLGLIKGLCALAFKKEDKELLYLSLNSIIAFDELLDQESKKEGEPVEKKEEIESAAEVPVEKTDEIKEEIEGEQPVVVEPPKEKPILSEKEAEYQILRKKYGVKKEAEKYILRNIPKDEFTTVEVGDVLLEYYRKVLKNEITQEVSIRTYARSYVKFLVAIGLVAWDDEPVDFPDKLRKYHLVVSEAVEVPADKVDRFKLSKYAQHILLWSEKNGTDLIDMQTMLDNKLEGSIGMGYRIRDIKQGMAELVEQGIASNLLKGIYGIKKERIK